VWRLFWAVTGMSAARHLWMGECAAVRRFWKGDVSLVIDRRRHARAVRHGSGFGTKGGSGGVAHLYRGANSRASFRDIYAVDHAEPRSEGRFRWLVSTCLAATVGAVAILVVIFGSADRREKGIAPAWEQIRKSTTAPPLASLLRREKGLKWAVPRADRLRVIPGAMSTRSIIHETLRQKRGGREYIYAKPYVRIVARLAPVSAEVAEAIPSFNPFKLYADAKPIGSSQSGRDDSDESSDVTIRVVELLGGILPGEDGQELDAKEAEELVAKAEAASVEFHDGATNALEGEAESPLEAPLSQSQDSEVEVAGPNTTLLAKVSSDSEDVHGDVEGLKRIVKTVGKRTTITKMLSEAGADTWQVREMLEAMKVVFPKRYVKPGQQVYISLAPSIVKKNRLEPIKFSIFDEGHIHRVTVTRNNAGEFVASATPVDEDSLIRFALGDGEQSQSTMLYSSLYHAGLEQSIPAETIMQILRIHAYETDFRRRLRIGDSCEFFFDLKDEIGTEGPPGELLFTSISAGGERTHYYRFRTPDGVVDYYDPKGNNSKKFLMRRPVRGSNVRLTSGFGVRFHPLLNERRRHNGVDWAAKSGTPILAAGNGTIEEAGRKGQYGNYIRIRHANGYKSAYGHMRRLAKGAAKGVKVRQGQVIGYVGSTGLSSGPHLHFEVLVNKQFVDPLSIQVPRERQLEGKDLAEFQRERARIDELMRRTPVMKASK
jgi:murein DD-endopeptidase MepM/ murein hydrolase activator NlpD